MLGRNCCGMSPPFSSRRGMRVSLPGHAARSRAAPTLRPSQISPLFTSFPHIPLLAFLFLPPPSFNRFFFFSLHPGSDSQQPRATRRDKLWRTQPFIFPTNNCLCRALDAPHPPVHRFIREHIRLTCVRIRNALRDSGARSNSAAVPSLN